MLNSVQLANPYAGYSNQVRMGNSTVQRGSNPEGVGENQNEQKLQGSSEKGEEVAVQGASEDVSESPDAQREVQELITIEDKVIAHEQAHMAAGGEFAGAANYSYSMGPDGKRYISGGEVSISIPSVDDPEEMARLLERVRQAALAPADPSAQDIKVASSAASRMAKINAEIASKKAEETYKPQQAGASDPKQSASSGKDSKQESIQSIFEMTI